IAHDGRELRLRAEQADSMEGRHHAQPDEVEPTFIPIEELGRARWIGPLNPITPTTLDLVAQQSAAVWSADDQQGVGSARAFAGDRQRSLGGIFEVVVFVMSARWFERTGHREDPRNRIEDRFEPTLD